MAKNIHKQFSYKIIDIKKLKKIAGNFPRKNKIILCHGNFDVVHPGHVRHLTYAKTKAKILVVSITADEYIQKGTYRPFVPESLRALNLAAFQMVDYVIIDRNHKPLKNLSIIKPDFFAKGFEYSSSSMPPATEEEAKIVENYGGEMIFTPGDIVYSSTKLLKFITTQDIKREAF
jgi:cytidyltransferase-related domain